MKFAIVFLFLVFTPFLTLAQKNYEDVPISDVEIVFENSRAIPTLVERLEMSVRKVLGDKFSAVKNREALQTLFDSERVASARLEVVEKTAPTRSVILRFVVRRNTQVERTIINISESRGDNVTEEELLLRLNLLTSGAILTERALQQSADTIQSYLRERGFYKAEVSYRTEQSERQSRVNAVFNVAPNEQARVENFAINIQGFNPAEVSQDLDLKNNEFFSREKLEKDIERIRRELVEQEYLAARIEDPQITFDSETNRVSIVLNGNVNAKVAVRIEDETGNEIEIGEGTLRRLLPIKSEGEVDRASIEQGANRLRNRFQEDGYFFAEVSARCSIDPFTPDDANAFRNNTETACDFLDNANLVGKKVSVIYQADLNRRFRLTELRLEGTGKLTIDDIRPALRSQEANALAIIPRLGYGRGYTSNEILANDTNTIEALMRELGHRRVRVSARQGVTPTGEDLIITFVVSEGPITRVSDVLINGNTAFSDDQLKPELPTLENQPFSRVRARNGNNRILNFYARNGYIDARSTFSIDEQPTQTPDEERVRIVYNLEREGAKTFINRVLTFGSNNVKRESVLETVPIKSGDLLRADRLVESERNLYATDAFRQINITSEPAGTNSDGSERRDVLIELQDTAPRILSYGGGFSTDDGPSGFVDIRHVNLFGRLYQGGARIRASRRQQLVQLDFVNPRFRREGESRFSPLNITASYLRDTGVTRFFRTTLDRGALGVVQRLDEEGNPIDEFGVRTSVPSINRYTFNIETSRTINVKTRSLLFVRYRYEDVRLLNTRSLLVAPLLDPDRFVRVSGIGATFGRDTRENCNNKRSILEVIRTGEAGNPCQYNAGDATRGEFLSLDYQLSARFLGANTSYNRLTATYQRYLQINALKKTVLAGRVNLGLASLFQVRDRDGNGVIDETDRTLPISERFFAGGSTTLRGFDFEEAGPRTVVVPQGTFRNNQGELVNETGLLNPFTVPVGGNALAIVNLEARIPLISSFQIVPFYDGGNVFRRVSEIFKPRNVTPGDVASTNFRALWSNTVGVGVRLATPIGGSIAIDYGYLLNPPEFLIPQPAAPPAIYRLQQGRIHFRFTQAF